MGKQSEVESQMAFKARKQAVYNYEKQLKDRVRLLHLRHQELFLTIEIDRLEKVHQETFPELYKIDEPKQLQVTNVKERKEEDGVTDSESESNPKES